MRLTTKEGDFKSGGCRVSRLCRGNFSCQRSRSRDRLPLSRTIRTGSYRRTRVRENGTKVYCRSHGHGHHHHLTCRKCGTTERIDPARRIGRVAQGFGYTEISHVMEVRARSVRRTISFSGWGKPSKIILPATRYLPCQFDHSL